jgi:hypothetical protein
MPETVRQGVQQYAADSGSANAYAVTLSPAATAYTTGMVVRFKATNANTSASTLNVNGLGTKNIYSRAAAALVANDIVANQLCECVYDGTQFQLIGSLRAGEVTAAKTDFTGATSKATPLTTDEVVLLDNAASGATKRATIASIVGVRQIVAAQDTAVYSHAGTAQTINAVLEWGTGTELTGMAVTVTPTATANTLLVEAALQVGTSGGNTLVVGVWRDPSGAGDDAAAAVLFSGSDILDSGILCLQFKVAAGSTSATTFKFRLARIAAGTAYVNRTGSAAALLNSAQVFSASKVTEYV